jgi:hypothetical protein
MWKPSLVCARENCRARYQGEKRIDVGCFLKVGRKLPSRTRPFNRHKKTDITVGFLWITASAAKAQLKARP